MANYSGTIFYGVLFICAISWFLFLKLYIINEGGIESQEVFFQNRLIAMSNSDHLVFITTLNLQLYVFFILSLSNALNGT